MNLAEVRRVLDVAAVDLPVDELPDLIGLLESIKARALARMTVPAPTVPISSGWVCADRIAEAFDVPVSQVYALARQDRIPHVKIGKYTRFDLEAVRHALARADSAKWVSFGARKKRSNSKDIGASATTVPPHQASKIAGATRAD
jgi:hypothetical protein